MKIIAVISMIFSHVAWAIFYPLCLKTRSESYKDVYMIFQELGRMAFPIFCFLLTEGYFHTKNKKRFLNRLLIFTLISEIPFDLFYGGKIFIPEHQNVFFNLSLGLLAIMGYELFVNSDFFAKRKGFVKQLSFFSLGVTISFLFGDSLNLLTVEWMEKLLHKNITVLGYTFRYYSGYFFLLSVAFGIVSLIILNLLSMKKYEWMVYCEHFFPVGICVILGGILRADYLSFGVLIIFLFYIFKNNRYLGTVVTCLVLCLLSFSEVTALFAVPLILLYNGTRGGKQKYFFYLFYPVHLILLFTVAQIFL